MALLPDCGSVELSSFNGAYVPTASGVDSTKIPIQNGILAENVQFFGQNVATRYGHSLVFSPAQILSAMVNWLFLNGTTPANYLAWHRPGTGINIASLASPSSAAAMAETTSATASMCPLGSRLYAAFMDANGVGVAAGQVYGFGVGADPLFAAPIATAPTFSELGGAYTTAGAKNFGYLIRTRNGYITRPSPAPSSDFTPTSYTSLGGAIVMAVDPAAHTWPAYALEIAPIMTTTANPNRFYIVPSPFPGNSPWQTITRSAANQLLIEVTDSYLEANGTDATPYLLQMGQTVSGTAPINPSVIAPFGQRLAYFTLDSAGVPVVYFSDLSNYQSISAATSGVYLPGLQRSTTGFALRGLFYMLGPHWTYSVADSGAEPSTWADAQLVDGAIGGLGPFCVSLNSSQNYAWVADEAGLYLFQGGAYPSRPVSYWQRADWQRINFAQTTKIFVVDDKANQRVTVLAPLDSAVAPTHKLTWDYSLGTTPELVQYSLNRILASEFTPGAIAMVQNDTTKHLEEWLGPSSASFGVVRANDGTETRPYRDLTAAINSQYQYAPLPRGMQGRLVMHHGVQFRIRGESSVDSAGDPVGAQFTVYSLDGTRSVGPFDIALDVDPDAEILQRFFLQSEFASGLIATNAADSWFSLARLDHYYTGGMPSR